MEPSKEYTLHHAQGLLPRALFRRRLLRGGRSLGVTVNGDAIDLQIAVGTCTVLASSCDYFDGCHHWLYLLGRDGRPIDQLRMPDQFGFIQHVQRVSDHEISFGYFGSRDKWHLAVDERGFWSFSLQALVCRPNRFILSGRHLLVRRIRNASPD